MLRIYGLPAGFLMSVVSMVCAQTAVLPDSTRLLGPDTLMMLTVNHVEQAMEQLEKTRLYALYKDPVMQPFVDKIKTQLESLVQEQNDELLRVMVQDGLLPTGRLLLAIRVPKEQPIWESEPSLLGLVQWGRHSQQVREIIERGFQKQVDEGAHRKLERYRGYDIITMQKPAPVLEADSESPVMDPPEPRPNYYCFFDDSLLVSNDLAAIQFTLGQLGGAQSRTLADDADYQRSRRAVGSRYDAELYLNVRLLLEKVFMSGDEEAAGAMRKELASLGLDGLSGLSAAMAIAPSVGTDCSIKVLLAAGSPRRGILKMLELAGKPFRSPVFVDPRAGQMAYINLDIPSATAELFRILTAINPMFAAVMNNPITPPQADGSPGVILKDDLLDNLGDQVIYFNTIEADPTNEDGFREEQLFAVAVRDAERLNRSVAGLHSQFLAAGRPELQQDYLGYTLYAIPLESLLMPGMEMQQTRDNALALTVTQTHLLWGGQIAVEKAIQRLTRPQAESLSEKAWYRRAMSQIPPDAGMATIEHMQMAGQQAWATLKNGKLSGLIELDIQNDWVASLLPAFEALPDFEQVRSYFGLSLGWIRTRPDGFLMEMMDIPAPPETSN